MSAPGRFLATVIRLLREPFGAGGRKDARHIQVGKLGEQAAADHLVRQGYRILERNFNAGGGEIDIVAFRNGTVVFVEVKTRTANALIDPLRTVTWRKQRYVIKAAQTYCTLHGLNSEQVSTRFDAIGVALDEANRATSVKHVENAFQVTHKKFQ